MSKKKELGRNKKIFIKELTKTGNIRKSMQKAYSARSATMPHQLEERGKKMLENDPEVRSQILEIWEAQGLTLSLAAKEHYKILKSKTAKPLTKLRAVEMVYKEHGGKDQDAANNLNASLAGLVTLMFQKRKERGLSIPEGIIDAEVIE